MHPLSSFMKTLVTLILVVFLWSCNDDKNLIPECDTQCLLYTSNQIIDREGVYFESYAKTSSSKGEVIIVFYLKNKSNTNFTINYAQAQLSTKEHVRSSAIQLNDIEITVDPNQYITDSIVFEPINSLELYQAIQHKGDLEKEYTLGLDFIQNKEGEPIIKNEVLFSTSEANYNSFIKNYREEDAISIYAPQLENKTNQEILINGVNCEFTAYAIRSTLFVNIRIVNHGEEELIITPSTFGISNNPAPKYDALQNIVIRKGDRYIKSFEYEISPKLKAFDLSLRGIKYRSGKYLFDNDIHFKREY